MKRIIRCIIIFCLLFTCGCSPQEPRADIADGLSIISTRHDMSTFSGDENGCYRIISNEKSSIALSYIDFVTNSEKLISSEINVAPAIQASIFLTDNTLYLHTGESSPDYSAITSVLSQLAEDGTVISQIKFPHNSTISDGIARDNKYIYAVLADRSSRLATLIKIDKSEMTYEMLADFSFNAHICTVYRNSVILQNGARIISYDTVTNKQSSLFENSTGVMYGSGDKIFANRGSYSEIEILDIPSGVQHMARIDSPGMLGEFTVGNDCVIPGHLTLYTRSEIRNEQIIHYLDTATMKTVKTQKVADISSLQPVVRCGDKLIVLEMKQDSYPFIYEYKICLLSDYLNGTEEYTIINMAVK